MASDNDRSKKDQALPSWASWVFPAFGVLTWTAAAGQFVPLIWFIEALVNNWRNFFRDLWAALFSFVHFPYNFTPKQHDILTMTSICLFIGLVPLLFGKKNRRFFKKPIDIREHTLGAQFKIMFALLILVAFIFPFVDVEYFRFDASAILVGLILLVWLVFGGIGVAYIVTEKPSIKYLVPSMLSSIKSASIEFGENMRSVFFLKTPWQFNAFFISVFILGFFFLLPLVVLIWLLREHYFENFHVENTVNLICLLSLSGTLIFAARRSLVPFLRLVVVGLVLLGVGSSAKVLVDAYQRNFSEPAVKNSTNSRGNTSEPER